MFGFPRKKKTTVSQKTTGSLLTCPDDQFVSRFSALWDSLKDENGNIHLYMTEDDLVTADRIYVGKITTDTLFVPDENM